MPKTNTFLIIGGAIAIGAAAFFLLRSQPGRNGAVGGIVTDDVTGEPISGVSVTFGGPVVGGTVTGANGAYGDITIPEGTYGFTFSKAGFLTRELIVEIIADLTIQRDIALTASTAGAEIVDIIVS